MLINAREIPDGEILRADVCVAGAGPTGIAVARNLAARGFDVLLVEAGDFVPHAEIEALSQGEIAVGSRLPSLQLYRRRVIGGTTYVWGGRCTPFDPIDFEARPWFPDSGWPITYAELLPWYEPANTFLDAGRFDYTVSGSLNGEGSFLDGFSSPWLHTDRIERFSRPTNMGRHYRNEIIRSTKLRLLHHAICTSVRLHSDGRTTDHVELRTLAGCRIRVATKIYVLALGTLETVRILLASRARMPNGIGNHSDWLGRSYLTHLEGNVGELRLTPRDKPVIWGYEKSDDGIYVRRRFAVSAAAQAAFGIGNGIARLNHPSVVDPSHRDGILSAAYLVKNLLVPEYSLRISWTDRRTAARLAEMGRSSLLRRHAANIIRDLPRVAAFGPWWLWVRNLRRRKMPSLVLHSRTGKYPLDFNVEQAPNRQSRIDLSDNVDRFGVPQLKVDWRMGDLDRRTIGGTLNLFRQAIADSGCGEFEYDGETALDQFMAVGGHQMGGARMSADPSQGVVDVDCRVHGIGNLYLAGNCVFPTVGYANPTLTAVALAHRLAAHIGHKLKG